MQPRAIETRYQGYRFRSRTEARWAVFLTKLGLLWEYEPEGFDLEGAGWYLPDFRVFQQLGRPIYLEIKPPVPVSAADFGKVDAFAQKMCLPDSGRAIVMLAQGDPATAFASIYRFDASEGLVLRDERHGAEFFEFWKLVSRGGDVGQAMASARSARFEHGESGAR